MSIRFDDDESKTVVVVGVSQDAEVQRVVVGPAVGSIHDSGGYNENMQELEAGESGFVVLVSHKGGQAQYALATQDGKTAITCKCVYNSGGQQWYEVVSRQTPVTITSLLKLPSAIPTGDLAELPKVLCEIYSDDTAAVIKALHAPADNLVEGAFAIKLYASPNNQAQWGGEYMTLLIP